MATTESANPVQLQPDIVIVFKYSRSQDKDAATDSRRVRAWQEIVMRLADQAIEATVDSKVVDEERVAILVRCSDRAIAESVEAEGLHEYLMGGPSSLLPVPFLDTPTPSNRIRTAYNLVTTSRMRGGIGIELGSGTAITGAETQDIGTDDGVDVAEFVEAVFPLMDKDFNKAWLDSWRSKYSLSTADLTAVRDIYGEGVAFYFAYLYFYFQWLIPLSAVGVFAWVTGTGKFQAWWAVFVIIWGILFARFWYRHSINLSYRWKTFYIAKTETPLPTFSPDHPFVNPFTGAAVPVKVPRPVLDETARVLGVASGGKAFERFPLGAWLTNVLVSIPAQLIGFFVLLVLNAVVFSLDTYINEYYNGPFKIPLAAFGPLIVFLIFGPPLASYLTILARTLTNWENHETATARDRDLTFKMFVFQGMAAFFPGLFLTFVYMPFGGKVWWLKHPPRRERLEETVIFLLVTNQLVDMLVENILPRFLRGLTKEVENVQKRGIQKTLSTVGVGGIARAAVGQIKSQLVRATSGDAILDQIRTELDWEPYDTFLDFTEMTIQFGNVVLFSIIFPLAPLVALLNNVLEIRTDVYKFSTTARRPVPKRASGIGGWEDALGIIIFVAAITNATLVAYFSSSDCTHDPSSCTGPLDIDWAVVSAAVFAAQIGFFAFSYVANQLAESIPVEAIDEELASERERRAEVLATVQLGPKPETMAGNGIPPALPGLLKELQNGQVEVSHVTDFAALVGVSSTDGPLISGATDASSGKPSASYGTFGTTE